MLINFLYSSEKPSILTLHTQQNSNSSSSGSAFGKTTLITDSKVSKNFEILMILLLKDISKQIKYNSNFDETSFLNFLSQIKTYF